MQQTRLACGVRPDLVALVDIPYVNAHRARLLFDRGLRSLKDVAAAGPDQVAAALLAGVVPLEVPLCKERCWVVKFGRAGTAEVLNLWKHHIQSLVNVRLTVRFDIDWYIQRRLVDQLLRLGAVGRIKKPFSLRSWMDRCRVKT